MSPDPVGRVLARGDDSRHPLLLLHGSHGGELDLVPLARRLAPGATYLALRGTVRLSDGHAFFRRHPDRRIDEDDLRSRIPGLVSAVRDHRPELRGRRPVAVGFSNGAITATALMTSAPDLLSGAVIIRPLTPFATLPDARLDGLPVLLLEAAADERRSPGDGARCADWLALLGADVTHHMVPATHAITALDEQLAGSWLQALGIPGDNP